MSKNLYNKIVAKFLYLDKYIRYLKELQKASRAEFLDDFKIFGTTERFFQLSIEVLIDTGKILISAMELERPEENKDIFEILFESKIITRNLHQKLQGIVGFRNILVHEYTEIDLKIVYAKLHDSIDDFKTFKRQILKYLDHSL